MENQYYCVVMVNVIYGYVQNERLKVLNELLGPNYDLSTAPSTMDNLSFSDMRQLAIRIQIQAKIRGIVHILLLCVFAPAVSLSFLSELSPNLLILQLPVKFPSACLVRGVETIGSVTFGKNILFFRLGLIPDTTHFLTLFSSPLSLQLFFLE